jgi:hypothetical protein
METQGTATPIITATDVIASSGVESAKIETPAEAAAVEAPKEVEEDGFSKKFAALSKRERELKLKDDELKAKMSNYSSVDEYKKLAKTDVNKWLEESGVSFDEITEYYLNGAQSKDPKLSEVEQKLEALEKTLKKKETDAAEAERVAAVNGFKTSQKEHILSKASEYELIAATDSYELVYDVTKQHYDKTNKVLTHDEAAAMVEAYLEKEVEKVLKASKIRNKFATQAEYKTETGTKTEPAKETIKTLNNSMTGATGSPSSKILTREESLERAASLLKFT